MNEAIRLYKERRYEQALKEFLAVRVESSEYPELSYYLGLCYTQLSRYDEAVLYLEQVVASELGFAQLYQARMVLGYIYAVTKRYRLAEYEFNQLLEEGYESAKVYSALAYACFYQGNVDLAIAHLEHALLIDPENSNALNSLGYVLADQGNNLSRAISYCKRAVAKSPRNPAYLDSLGWCLYRNGRRKEAEEVLERAAQLGPRLPEIRQHLKEVRKGKA
ncbi:tetratricopeptide repeat protein [Salinispira pacifica]